MYADSSWLSMTRCTSTTELRQPYHDSVATAGPPGSVGRQDPAQHHHYYYSQCHRRQQ